MKTKYYISKGYNIQLKGDAKQELHQLFPDFFYVHPSDFRWLTPKLLVAEGDEVQIGTPLFADKNNAEMVVVSPICGTVKQIVRGEKRVIQAIVLGRNSDTCSLPQSVERPTDRASLLRLLLQYGLFPFFRQRPFSTIPNPEVMPKAIFIPCFDSAPLAPDYNFLMQNRFDDFYEGIRLLKMLCPRLCLCMNRDLDNIAFRATADVEHYFFQGPHPAGNVGTHIHKVSPINKGETVWYIQPQDVATIGHLFLKNELSFEKIIAVTGPCIDKPAYWQMIYGADCSSLFDIKGERKVRKISGNILTGSQLFDFPSVRFYDSQITMIPEGGEREFMGWLLPGLKKWSLSHTFLSWLGIRDKYDFSTSLQGGHRNFVMTDIYEKVFPFDIIPLSLLKACITKDIEMMENLGIYEVDDEDFALCEVVCPSKMNCQQIIRDALFYLKNN